MSESNAVSLIAAPETAYGVVPTGGTYSQIEYTAERFTATPRTAISQTVRVDRHKSDQFITGLDVLGGYDFELVPGKHDEFMEAAMHGTWTGDVLRIGTTDRSFSIEKSYTDLTTVQYAMMTGMRADTFSLNMAYGAPVTGRFTFMGNGVETGTSTFINTGTVTPSTISEVFNASADFGNLMIDGAAATICARSAGLTVNNNMRPIECMGEAAPSNQAKGSAMVEFNFEAYMDEGSWALYEKALTQTDSQIEFTLTQGTASYSFDLPRVKLNGEMPQSTGLDTDVFLNLKGTALVDTNGDSLIITRTV